MKKKILGIAGIVLAASISLGIYAYDAPISDPTFDANVEALTVTENSPGQWNVRDTSSDSWECKQGGTTCCPGPHQTSC